MNDEGNLLAAGRCTYLCNTLGVDLANQVAVAAVAHDTDVYTLRLAALTNGVNLTIVSVAQRTVVGCCQETHGVGLVLGNLLVLSAIQTTIPHVECTVLLAQVVITLAIGSPYRCTVLTHEVGQLCELLLVLRHQPDVAADGRLVVLTIHILAALDVVIQHIARLAVDVYIGHWERSEHTWTTALYAHLVDLWELPKAGDD